MRLSMRAVSFTSAILWGGCLLVTGLIHLGVPSYGTAFLGVMSSVYPGYHAARSFGDVLTGTGYALVDGAVGGLILGWLYNLFVGRPA